MYYYDDEIIFTLVFVQYRLDKWRREYFIVLQFQGYLYHLMEECSEKDIYLCFRLYYTMVVLVNVYLFKR